MKLFLPLIVVLMLTLPILPQTATVNGRFVVVNRDTVTKVVSVKLQLNVDDRIDSLGTSTLLITLGNGLALSQTPVAGAHFVFHNFSSVNYAPATITKPFANQNQYSINIELMGAAETATPVAKQPNWTDVVTLHCTTTVPVPSSQQVSFIASNPDFALYDNDNLTPWTKGIFTNLEFLTSIELTSFTLSKGDNEAILYWETATEKNNSGFEVERKIQE